jgi:antitoxin CptB
MRELDLLLGEFMETGFARLSGEDRARFRALLRCPDQDLYQWLLGTAEPMDEDLARVVGLVRRAPGP